jgi:hypothetical protein
MRLQPGRLPIRSGAEEYVGQARAENAAIGDWHSGSAVPARLVYLGCAIALHAAISQLVYGGFWIDVHAPIAQVQGGAEIMYYAAT